MFEDRTENTDLVKRAADAHTANLAGPEAEDRRAPV
jgi:hypothetical protein